MTIALYSVLGIVTLVPIFPAAQQDLARSIISCTVRICHRLCVKHVEFTAALFHFSEW